MLYVRRAKQAQNLQKVLVLPNQILMYCSIDKQSTCKFSNSAYFIKSNPNVHNIYTVVKQKTQIVSNSTFFF